MTNKIHCLFTNKIHCKIEFDKFFSIHLIGYNQTNNLS